MNLHVTPGFAVASLLTATIVLWIVIDLANGDTAPTQLTNVITVSAGIAWLYVASGWRSEYRARKANRQEVDNTIRHIR